MYCDVQSCLKTEANRKISVLLRGKQLRRIVLYVIKQNEDEWS